MIFCRSFCKLQALTYQLFNFRMIDRIALPDILIHRTKYWASYPNDGYTNQLQFRNIWIIKK